MNNYNVDDILICIDDNLDLSNNYEYDIEYLKYGNKYIINTVGDDNYLGVSKYLINYRSYLPFAFKSNRFITLQEYRELEINKLIEE